MKFAKRLLAGICTGVMALSMLASCSGSTSKNTYKNSKIYKMMEESKAGATIYIELESYSNENTQYLTEAQKGDNFYISTSNADGSIDSRMYSDGEKVYTVDDVNKTVSVVSMEALKQYSQSLIGIPDEDTIKSFEAKYEEFNDVEYWCETIVINVNGMEMTEKYYFLGDEIKYIVSTYSYNGSEGEIVEKINKYLNYLPEGFEIEYSLPEGYTEI